MNILLIAMVNLQLCLSFNSFEAPIIVHIINIAVSVIIIVASVNELRRSLK